MFYDEAMQKFREEYEKDKDTKTHLIHENKEMIIEFFPQLDDNLIQYCVIKDKKDSGINNTVGYVDNLNINLLLSNNWELMEE